MAALVLCSCINTNVILKNHSSKRELGKNKENTKVQNKRMESYKQREYNTTDLQNVLKKKEKKNDYQTISHLSDCASENKLFS